jgi:hypothetical protein
MFLGKKKKVEKIKTENTLAPIVSSWVSNIPEDPKTEQSVTKSISDFNKFKENKRAGVDSHKLTKNQLVNQGVLEKKEKTELQKKILKKPKSKLTDFEEETTIQKVNDVEESFGKGGYSHKRKSREYIKQIENERNAIKKK